MQLVLVVQEAHSVAVVALLVELEARPHLLAQQVHLEELEAALLAIDPLEALLLEMVWQGELVELDQLLLQLVLEMVALVALEKLILNTGYKEKL
jgi:hypothetical protein